MDPGTRCNIWHVRGRDRDLLLDSGMGLVSLRSHVGLVTEKPLLCVASQAHFDHVGGHHEFEERLVRQMNLVMTVAFGLPDDFLSGTMG